MMHFLSSYEIKLVTMPFFYVNDTKTSILISIPLRYLPEQRSLHFTRSWLDIQDEELRILAALFNTSSWDSSKPHQICSFVGQVPQLSMNDTLSCLFSSSNQHRICPLSFTRPSQCGQPNMLNKKLSDHISWIAFVHLWTRMGRKCQSYSQWMEELGSPWRQTGLPLRSVCLTLVLPTGDTNTSLTWNNWFTLWHLASIMDYRVKSAARWA